MLVSRLTILAVKILNDYSSSLSVRLVKITGKHKDFVHVKHLVNEPVWFKEYLSNKDVILDLGSGTGRLSVSISKNVSKIVGLEIDSKLIKIAEQEAKRLDMNNISFIKADANKKLPFKNSTFTKILACDVLEHLNERSFALSEIKRVLKKNGLLFLVTDNPETSWKKLQKSYGLFYYADKDHKYEYHKKEIIKLLNAKNFRVQKISTVTYDTPFKGLIDLTGGISITIYKKLRKWRKRMSQKYPLETTGFRIIAKKL